MVRRIPKRVVRLIGYQGPTRNLGPFDDVIEKEEKKCGFFGGSDVIKQIYTNSAKG